VVPAFATRPGVPVEPATSEICGSERTGSRVEVGDEPAQAASIHRAHAHTQIRGSLCLAILTFGFRRCDSSLGCSISAQGLGRILS
jgi:hypothetical protein